METFEKQCGIQYVSNLTIQRAFLDHPEWQGDELPVEDMTTDNEEISDDDTDSDDDDDNFLEEFMVPFMKVFRDWLVYTQEAHQRVTHMVWICH